MGSAAIFVIGPAGSGKTTFCNNMAVHGEIKNLNFKIVNLDTANPNAENAFIDVNDIIQAKTIQKEEGLGPNGALIRSFELLAENISWLDEQLSTLTDEFLLVDCPGQIELYIHNEGTKQIIRTFQKYCVCASVYLIDVQYLDDPTKYISASLIALCAMVNLVLPHINVITKIDAVAKDDYDEFVTSIEKYLVPGEELLDDLNNVSKDFKRLNESIVSTLSTFSLLSYVPVDWSEPDSVDALFAVMDRCVGYTEDLEVREER